MQVLLANGASAIHEDVCGRTPLFRATWAGSVEAVLALLSAPSVDIEAKDVEGCTSLAAAAFKNHVEVLQVLIDRGADTMAVGSFAILIRLSHPPTVSPPDGWPIFSPTFLVSLCAKKTSFNPPTLLLLPIAHAFCARQMDTRGRTPLIRAAISNSGETAAILLDAGVPVDGTDTHGATAAWYACSEDSPAVLSQLLDRDCDLNVSTLLILLCIWSPRVLLRRDNCAHSSSTDVDAVMPGCS